MAKRHFIPLPLLCAAAFAFAGCAPPALPDAANLIAQARATHGSARLDSAVVRFTFRDAAFRVERSGGRFEYRRVTTDSLGRAVAEILTNDGLTMRIAGERAALTPAQTAAAETRVNSVVYFALLPYALADPAVRAQTVGADTLGGVPYWQVAVTFAEEGGGRDHEDRFVYWLRQDDAALDYLAYTFEVNGGGARFRAAQHVRTVGGVRFADYANYRAPDGVALEDLGALYETGRLPLISTVETADVVVE